MAEDGMGTRETLSRLEAGLLNLTDKVGVFSDEVITLKAQQENQAKRLESISNENQRALTEVTTSFKTEFASITASMRQFDERSRPQWGLWIAAVGVFCTMMGGTVWVTSLWISSAVAQSSGPILADIASLRAAVAPVHDIEIASKASAVADADSRRDRDEINRRLSRIEQQEGDHTAERREQIAALKQNTIEVETQFKNLTQLMYLLWEKAFNMKFPIVPREVTPG